MLPSLPSRRQMLLRADKMARSVGSTVLKYSGLMAGGRALKLSDTLRFLVLWPFFF
jgi:hypothetical protein